MSLIGGVGGINPSTTSPLTNYLWSTHFNGKVNFDKSGNLSIQPTEFGNRMGTQWTLDSENSFRTGPIASTQMGVPAQTQEIENFMSELFSNRNNVQFKVDAQTRDGDFANLTILDKINQPFIMTGRIKPEVRYGPAVTEFYNIRPSLPSDNTPSKFMIRGVSMDDNGITRGSTEWKPYGGQINDLKDLSSNEMIGIRVKKYAIPIDQHNAQQQWAYFLDMVFSREAIAGSL